MTEALAKLNGILHIYIAFDWGEDINLARARELMPAEQTELPRRRRTPPSIDYSPPPLRFHLQPINVNLSMLGSVAPTSEATVFDFGAVSIALDVPFELTADELLQVAESLAEPQQLVAKARAAIEPLRTRLLPAIQNASTSAISEEYFVFHLPPSAQLEPKTVLSKRAAWLAGVLRLESAPLSEQSINEAVRLHLSYSPDDLFVAEWSAAVLIDLDCDETLQTIELANVQLLEYRQIDDTLDKRLAEAYHDIHPLVRRWLPFWRTHTKPLRMLGDVKIGANELFDRTSNVLKLFGDQYLARVHRLLAARFHLEQWEQSIRESLKTAEGVYQILSDQAASYRTELLEIIIILLILFEIITTFVGH